MNFIPRTLVIALLLGGTVFPTTLQSKQQDTESVSGKITRVTLYRERALIEREIVVPAGTHLRAIKIADLPEQLVPDSVYAESDSPAVVRAVRVSPVSLSSQPVEGSEALKKQLEISKKQTTRLERQLKVIDENEKLLARMVSFSASTGKSDLGRGVLDADAITELTLFVMTQRSSLSQQRLDLENELTEAESKLEQLEWQLDRTSQLNGQPRYEARIFLDGGGDSAVTIRLGYLVNGCGWAPQYSIHGRTGDSAVMLQYGAVVNQLTGESWENVELVLSTATPSACASRPVLMPLRVSSTSAQQGPADKDDPFDEGDYSGQSDEQELTRLTNVLRENRRFAESEQGGSPGSSETRDIQLNLLAGQLQQIELQANSRSLRTLAIDASDDLASQTYQIAKPVSLDSRREQQLIQILTADMTGEMYHVVTPLLSSFGYRQAKVTNSEAVGFLGGPASVYLDDHFVGLIEIPSTASGQKLTIGFGVDPQIRTRRELVRKTDDLKGGNRQVRFNFRLVISNFKKEPVSVRLVDRIPIAIESQQLSVSLESLQHPLSDDALYLRTLRHLGILRWDITIPAQRIGADAMDVFYDYTLEFDRSQIPTTQHSIDEIIADYSESSGRGGGGGFGGGGGIFFTDDNQN